MIKKKNGSLHANFEIKYPDNTLFASDQGWTYDLMSIGRNKTNLLKIADRGKVFEDLKLSSI
jgi:hypothetical protein